MRLLFWGLLFLLVLFGSFVGVAASFSSLALVAVFAFLFLVGIVGLVVTGLVYLVRAVQFGHREAYGQPAVTQRGRSSGATPRGSSRTTSAARASDMSTNSQPWAGGGSGG